MRGYNAALGQMIGVNMYLWGEKKKLMQFVAKPVIKIVIFLR